jgi:hypothetical protein
MEPTTPPPPPAAPQAGSSSQATISLVLGIVGIVCCGLAAPFAWWMGQKEIAAIDAGASSEAGRGLATAGKILGIIGTILLVLALIWVVGFGGLAFLSALSGANG